MLGEQLLSSADRSGCGQGEGAWSSDGCGCRMGCGQERGVDRWSGRVEPGAWGRDQVWRGHVQPQWAWPAPMITTNGSKGAVSVGAGAGPGSQGGTLGVWPCAVGVANPLTNAGRGSSMGAGPVAAWAGPSSWGWSQQAWSAAGGVAECWGVWPNAVGVRRASKGNGASGVRGPRDGGGEAWLGVGGAEVGGASPDPTPPTTGTAWTT